MFGEKTSEKSYTRSGYELYECPRCHGFGSEGVFHKFSCEKCDGTGNIMIESKREVETASHRHQDDNNERKNAWLFS
jgi:DnaJ-class molecular chaperone